MVRVPGLDNPTALAKTGAVPINHLGRYAEPERAGGRDRRRDRQALADLGRDRLQRRERRRRPLLEIHPAVNFAAGHRYIVALRDLRERRRAR